MRRSACPRVRVLSERQAGWEGFGFAKGSGNVRPTVPDPTWLRPVDLCYGYFPKSYMRTSHRRAQYGPESGTLGSRGGAIFGVGFVYKDHSPSGGNMKQPCHSHRVKSKSQRNNKNEKQKLIVNCNTVMVRCLRHGFSLLGAQEDLWLARSPKTRNWALLTAESLWPPYGEGCSKLACTSRLWHHCASGLPL